MHIRSSQLYIAQREALERTFERAKIFFMTVDGFVQAADGLSSLSSFVTSYTYLETNIDQGHQLEYHQLAARVKKMNLCMDEGQRIDFDKKCNAMGQIVACSSKTLYPW